MVWLSGGEKKFENILAVSTEYRRMTDRQTDRRTGGLTSRDSIALRGKN